jgi:tetratricopeptide (TPR) repeat protein
MSEPILPPATDSTAVGRRPRRLRLAIVFVCLTALVLAVGWHFVSQMAERRIAAEEAYYQGRERMQLDQFEFAVESFQRAQDLAHGLPGSAALAADIADKIRVAGRAAQVRKLRPIVNELRLRYLTETFPPHSRQADELDAACRNAWEMRDLLASPSTAELLPHFKGQIEVDLMDLAILWPEFRVRLAPASRKPERHKDALAALADAARRFGPNVVLDYEQMYHAVQLKDKATAERFRKAAQARPPATGWEHFALGRYHLREGKLPEAARELQRVLELEPFNFFGHYYMGACWLRGGQWLPAVAEFSVCLGQAGPADRSPRAQSHLFRGMAWVGLASADAALRDFDAALRLDDNLANAYLQRGAIYHQKGQEDKARQDLEQALARGADSGPTHYQLALVAIAQKNWPAARSHLRTVLTDYPNQADANRLLKKIPPE